MSDQQQDRRVIKFYGTGGDYGCFSNFAHSPFRLNGQTWPSVEHYFQAAKFPDTEHAEAIRLAKSPGKAVTWVRIP